MKERIIDRQETANERMLQAWAKESSNSLLVAIHF